MLPVLDNDQMRDADNHTIHDLGVPGIVLMENAATGAVDCLREAFPEAERVLILCGRGNNGGDGLAMARHLQNGGVEVRVLLFGEPDALSPDAHTNFELAQAFGVPLTISAGLDELHQALDELAPEVVVDALLGTGLDSPLGGRLAEVAGVVEDCEIPVLAVDVPTGLNGASSGVPGPVIPAEVTVTFGALKHCHVLPPAAEHCGEVAVVDIGIPPARLEKDCRLRWVEEEDIRLLLPHREVGGHKGHFGHLLIASGSTGRGGAVSMAANSAVVAGSGLVTMAVPEPLVPVVDGTCLEAMSHPLPAAADGSIADATGLEELLERVDAVATGPGMGTGTGARRFLHWLLEHWQGPLVADADALNLLAGDLGRLQARQEATVLTPHPGELARLLGRSTSEVVEDRLGAARAAAEASGAVVIAKGYHSIIAAPDGEAWINPTGDVHLASGGSGDVLTGLVGAFLAQGLDAVRAALVACWLHGAAGETGALDYPAAVPASTLPQYVAEAWHELLDEENED